MAKKRPLIGSPSILSCAFFLVSVAACREEEVGLQEKEGGEPGVKGVLVSKSFPPVGTSEVRAYSLPPGVPRFLENGKLVPEIDPLQGVVLTGELLAEACEALNSPKYHEMNFMCFEPHDALIFFDAGGEIVASAIICFTCYNHRIYPREFAQNLDYGLLARVFARPELQGGYPFETKGVDSYVAEYEGLLTKSFAKLAASRGRTVIPELWKVAEPKDKVRILSGDEVYVSSDIKLDPVDGKAKVDLRGFLKPKHCKNAVEIRGMTEAEASRVVRDLFLQEKIYHPSTRIKVVKASRFLDEK